MKGYRVGKGKKRTVYIYTDIITQEEMNVVVKYYISNGFSVEEKKKSVANKREKAQKSGFVNAMTRAKKADLIAYIDQYAEQKDKAILKQNLESVKKGGLGFAKAKRELIKKFPDYPEAPKEKKK